MTPSEILGDDLAEAAQTLRQQDKPFAFATIVRTSGSTAAKSGAKAVLAADGTLLKGWLGGGCTRGAVKKAAITALQTGQPQLISVIPDERLIEKGVQAGDVVDGTNYARNACPSKGAVDIFVEPFLPLPQLLVLGQAPVAMALVSLAPQFHWGVVQTPSETVVPRCVIVATQGQGDIDALEIAVGLGARHVAFVGSQRKFETLADKLRQAGADPAVINGIKAPAGLDLGAVTPKEIALSILADLIRVRHAPSEVTDV